MPVVPEPIRSREFTITTGHAGVAIRPATWRDAQTLATGVAQMRLYDDAPETVERWWRDPNTWMLVFERGATLQFEVIQFYHRNQDAARFVYTEHVLRGRPYWFWRALEQPVLQHMQALGINAAMSYARADRPAFVRALRDGYGAEDLGEVRVTATRLRELRYDIAEAIAAWPGVPERRTASAGWTQFGVREASVAEAQSLIVSGWSGASRAEEALRMFDERMLFDQARALIGANRIVYVTRESTPTLASVSCLTPFDGSSEEGEVEHGVALWLQAVGYTRAAVWFVPERLAHPLTQKWAARFGFSPGQKLNYHGETWIELAADVSASLARADTAWTA
jgi:hypothetical protein